MDRNKVPIELRPYTAITILGFLREFVNDDLVGDYMFQALREAVDEYEQQVSRALTDEQLEEIRAENQVNQLIGKSPKR